MNGILYFSSTGNSLYIAKRLKEKLTGKIVYIPKYQGDGSEFEKLFIVTPIHSYGLPRVVFDLLPRLHTQKEVYVIQNYGGMIGGADYLFFKYAQECNLNVKGIFTMKMPENYTLVFTVPRFYMNASLRKADRKIDEIVKKIESGKDFLPKRRKTKEAVYHKNMSNWHIIGQRFKVSDKCVRCQKCISICPVGNISLKDGEIVFGDKCVACLGCYHRCPNKAIVYKNKKKKDRYINPNIEEKEIGKDF